MEYLEEWRLVEKRCDGELVQSEAVISVQLDSQEKPPRVGNVSTVG